MDTVTHSYQIAFMDSATTNKKRVERIDFHFDADNFDLIQNTPTVDDSALPRWTKLNYKQCSHCPLNSEEHSHCPIAVNLHQLVSRFDDCQSIDRVEIEVITSDRRVIQQTDLQHAISSMLNLIIPGSGCPHTAKLKTLSRFHIPMISEEEAIFHITSLHLMGSYFHNANSSADFSQLPEFYQQMHILNKAIASRLQLATDSDACKNAITLQDMYATLIPLLVEDQLQEMHHVFQDFTTEESRTESTDTQHIEDTIAMRLELSPIEETDTPTWITSLNDEDTPDQIAAEEQTHQLIDSLGLSLAPMEEEKGAAVFKLPDD